MEQDYILKVEHVSKQFPGVKALDDVSIGVRRGTVHALVGENGAGKSTLIKLLNGIIFPSEGKYFYQGHEINEKALKNSQFAKWFHQQMGYVFQNADTQLFCGSVEEEIAFGPIQMGLPEAEIRQRTEDCLRLPGTPDPAAKSAAGRGGRGCPAEPVGSAVRLLSGGYL